MARTVATGKLKHALRREDLANVVYRRGGLSRAQAKALVEEFIAEISDALVRGSDVKLASFGVFHVRDKRQRMGRNPKSGRAALIAQRRVLTFRASPSLKRIVAPGARSDHVDKQDSKSAVSPGGNEAVHQNLG